MKNKPTLIVLILLLLVFVPATIYGTIIKIKDDDSKDKVSYNYAKSTLNNIDSEVNIYKKGTKQGIESFIVNNKEYSFITENNKVYLYSISDNRNIIDYDAINFYSTDIENNYVLVKRDNKWGILNLDTIKMIVPYEYDYLGLVDNIKDQKLSSDFFIVGNNNSYSIYSLKENDFKKVSNNFSGIIYDFNVSQLLLTLKNGDSYGIYDFEGNRFYSDYTIKSVKFTDSYIVFIDQNNILYVFNGLFSSPKQIYKLDKWNLLEVKEGNSKLDIYIDNALYNSIDI